MIRSQLHPVSLRNDRTRLLGRATASFRQFSAAQPRANDSRNTPADRPLVRRTLNRSNTPTANQNSRPNYPPRPRPQGGIDARSLGASGAGGQPKVLRAPMLRSPGFRRPNPARRPPRSNVKKPRAPRRAGPKEAEAEEGDDARLHEVNNAYRDITEAAKPVPVRYDPHQPDFSTLKETWPSLPTDASARAALVSEKLAGLSERYPNGYDPAHELGKRLFDGKPVQFANEEERNQAVEEAKKLAQKQADKLTQEKGDLVEPEEIIFDPISEADRKSLFRSLVQGDYTERESKLAETSPPVFADIMAGLKNNPTYQTAGKSSQFVAKVDSLLSSRRPAAKRG